MLSRRRCCCSTDTCRICVLVSTCLGNVSVTSATVTLSRDGSVVASCETDEASECCFDVTALGSGTYTATVTKTGYTGSNKTFEVSCPGTTTITLYVASGSGTILTVRSACGAVALAGAVLEINGGTYITDSAGQIHYTIPNGSFPWTLSWSPRFVTQTGTASRSICGSISGLSSPRTMDVASGYHCTGEPSFNGIPLADTLYGTDSVYGSLVATWGASVGVAGGAGWAVSAVSVNTAAICNCPAQSGVDVTYVTHHGSSVDEVTMTLESTPGPTHFCPKTAPTTSAFVGGWTVTTLTPPPNYLLVETMPACLPCSGASCTGGGVYLYPNGATLTFTE